MIHLPYRFYIVLPSDNHEKFPVNTYKTVVDCSMPAKEKNPLCWQL